MHIGSLSARFPVIRIKKGGSKDRIGRVGLVVRSRGPGWSDLTFRPGYRMGSNE
jgi:hypothetical protein